MKRASKRGTAYVETAIAVAAVVGIGAVAVKTTGIATKGASDREGACIAAGFEGCKPGDLGKIGDDKQNCLNGSSPLQCLVFRPTPVGPWLTFSPSSLKDPNKGGDEDVNAARSVEGTFSMGAAPPTGVRAFIKEFSHVISREEGIAPRHFFDFVLNVPAHNEELGMDVNKIVKVRMAVDEDGGGVAHVAFHELTTKYMNDAETRYIVGNAQTDKQAFEDLVGQMEAAVAAAMPDTHTLTFQGRDILLDDLRLPRLPKP